MRRALLVLLLAALALPAPTAATDTYVVLADWQEGAFPAGAPMAIEEPALNAVTIPFVADACPRTILLDLLYAPESARLVAPDGSYAGARFAWRAEVWRDGALASEVDVRSSNYGHAVGATSGEGTYILRLVLTTGVDVSWDARIRGREIVGEPGCSDPIAAKA